MTSKQIRHFYRASIIVCGALAVGLVPTMTIAAQKIYFSAGTTIHRANLDGTDIFDQKNQKP